jgi:CRP-like cAMP-binding protein
MAVLDGGPRSATIVALSLVSCLRLGRPAFLRLLNEHGSIGRKMLVEMSKRVRATEKPTDRH